MSMRSIILGSVTLAAATGSTFAGITGSLNVQASVDGTLATWNVPINVPDLGPTETWTWTMQNPYTFSNGAKMPSFRIEVVGDPVVNLFFGVQAAGVATNFTITSALNGFPVIASAEGRATAGITVTDDGALGNGATLTGNYAGNKAYRAFYNGAVPGAGATFATLVDGLVVPGAIVTDTTSEAFPVLAGTFSPIAGPVSTMSSQFSFLLTADDLASGTSSYVIRDQIPTPGAVSLLGLAGLVVARRRR